MAFKCSRISVLAYAGNFTLWHYETKDPIEELMSGYFDEFSNTMNDNDLIIIVAGDENCNAFVKKKDGKITLIKQNNKGE